MKKIREDIFNKTGGRCLYCGCSLNGTKWQADHVHPIIRRPEKGTCLHPEFDTYENIYPSCAPCNNFKSALDVEGFRHRVSEQFESVLKYSTGARQLHRLGLLSIEPSMPVVFWFESAGIEVPTKLQILGLKELLWHKCTDEPYSYYTDTKIGVCSLRRNQCHEWLAIHTKESWQQDRVALGNCSLDIAKLRATKWLMST